jgi:hypothetical protein
MVTTALALNCLIQLTRFVNGILRAPIYFFCFFPINRA